MVVGFFAPNMNHYFYKLAWQVNSEAEKRHRLVRRGSPSLRFQETLLGLDKIHLIN